MNPFGRKKDKIAKQNTKSEGDTVQTVPKKIPDFLKNFSEKQINHLYSVATIKRLSPKAYLFKEGQEEPFLSILLEGQANIVSTKSPVPFRVASGTILSAKEFFTHTPFKSAAYAVSPVTVMILEKKTFGMLDHQVSESLYSEIIMQSAQRSEELEMTNLKKSHKLSLLAKSLYETKTAQMYDYETSELIVNIVKKIPKLPVYTHTLSTKLLDENASSKEVVDLIRQDPALVADIIKSVNSSYYGLEQKVSDINSAVLLLGFQSLYQLIMSGGIRKTMPDTPSFRQIHARALAVSYIAFSLSMTAKVGVPVQMATIGLLHNMGESVVSLLVEKNPNLSIFINALDRSGLGAFLLECWKFPKIISQTVKYQSFPEFSEPEIIPKAILTHVTLLYISQMCYQVMLGTSEEDLPLIYLDAYKKILKLDNLGIEQIARTKVMADLRKKQDSLPVSLKNILNPNV